MKNKPEAVETEAEELLFYSDKERDAALGTIGHLRIDFGRSGDYEVYLLDNKHDAELIKQTSDLSFTLKVNTAILIKEK